MGRRLCGPGFLTNAPCAQGLRRGREGSAATTSTNGKASARGQGEKGLAKKKLRDRRRIGGAREDLVGGLTVTALRGGRSIITDPRVRGMTLDQCGEETGTYAQWGKTS